jgi:predicted Zn-dependent protease
MLFGENPREGFVEGSAFLHPEMKFRFDAPQGWAVQNQATAVLAASPQRDAVLRLTLTAAQTPDAAATAFLSGEGIQKGPTTAKPIHGLPAATADFRVAGEGGTMRGTVAFIAHDGKVFQLLGFTSEAGWPSHEAALRRTLGTFRTLTDPAALAVETYRIELVRVDRDTTLADFDRKHPSSIPLDRLAVINHVEATGKLAGGRAYKRVVGGKKKSA